MKTVREPTPQMVQAQSVCVHVCVYVCVWVGVFVWRGRVCVCKGTVGRCVAGNNASA